MKRSLYYFLAFVNRGRPVSSWHVMRLDGKTVCGRDLPITGTFGGRLSLAEMRTHARYTGTPDTCRSCLRMKDAETMRLA